MRAKVLIKLAAYMKAHDISKNELARRMGFDNPAMVRRFFKNTHGEYDPQISTVCWWAVALGCNLEDLVSFEEVPVTEAVSSLGRTSREIQNKRRAKADNARKKRKSKTKAK